jgi:hypothetical protein
MSRNCWRFVLFVFLSELSWGSETIDWVTNFCNLPEAILLFVMDTVLWFLIMLYEYVANHEGRRDIPLCHVTFLLGDKKMPSALRYLSVIQMSSNSVTTSRCESVWSVLLRHLVSCSCTTYQESLYSALWTHLSTSTITVSCGGSLCVHGLIAKLFQGRFQHPLLHYSSAFRFSV